MRNSNYEILRDNFEIIKAKGKKEKGPKWISKWIFKKATHAIRKYSIWNLERPLTRLSIILHSVWFFIIFVFTIINLSILSGFNSTNNIQDSISSATSLFGIMFIVSSIIGIPSFIAFKLQANNQLTSCLALHFIILFPWMLFAFEVSCGLAWWQFAKEKPENFLSFSVILVIQITLSFGWLPFLIFSIVLSLIFDLAYRICKICFCTKTQEHVTIKLEKYFPVCKFQQNLNQLQCGLCDKLRGKHYFKLLCNINHVFHGKCFMKYISLNRHCPKCKQAFPEQSLILASEKAFYVPSTRMLCHITMNTNFALATSYNRLFAFYGLGFSKFVEVSEGVAPAIIQRPYPPAINKLAGILVANTKDKCVFALRYFDGDLRLDAYNISTEHWFSLSKPNRVPTLLICMKERFLIGFVCMTNVVLIQEMDIQDQEAGWINAECNYLLPRRENKLNLVKSAEDEIMFLCDKTIVIKYSMQGKKFRLLKNVIITSAVNYFDSARNSIYSEGIFYSPWTHSITQYS